MFMQKKNSFRLLVQQILKFKGGLSAKDELDAIKANYIALSIKWTHQKTLTIRLKNVEFYQL